MNTKPFLMPFCAIVLSGLALQTAQATVDFSQLVEQVSPSVVRVNVAKKMTQEEILQQQLP